MSIDSGTAVARRAVLARGLARVTTEVLAPSVVVVALALAVAWQAARGPWLAVMWGAVVAATSSVLPMAVIVWGSRSGRWDGRHVRDRQGRLVPFLTLIVLSLGGLGLLLLGGAPWLLVALHLSMILSLFVTGAITIGWKISMHAGVAAGAVIVLVLVYGPSWWWAVPLVAAVSWSRVEIGDHTAAQVTLGVLVGAVVGGGAFALLA